MKIRLRLSLFVLTLLAACQPASANVDARARLQVYGLRTRFLLPRSYGKTNWAYGFVGRLSGGYQLYDQNG